MMDEGWKLNRHNYYQEGWLATGNVRGIVGVTFTSSHCKRGADAPLRTNYNLRGHHSQATFLSVRKAKTRMEGSAKQREPPGYPFLDHLRLFCFA
ncbi:hypothetical protein FOCC_FOCC006835, partial [Frankliniella occidentalis]